MIGIRRLRATRLVAPIALMLVLFFSLVGSALAGNLSGDEVKSLDQLETRFFEHTYEKEDSEARIERLEKLIFGEAKQGDQDSRLSQLMAAIPKADPADSQPASSGQANNNAPQNNDNSAATNSQNQQDAGQQQQQTADADDNSQDYPTVDALEQLILGKTFKNEGISQRLDQLEIKAFKEPSTNPDLSERVTRLSDYAQNHLHKSVQSMVDPRATLGYTSPDDDDNGGPSVRSPAYTGSPYGGGNYGGGGYGGSGSYGAGGTGAYGMGGNLAASASRNDYWTPPMPNTPESAQLSWLEMHVFGQANPNAAMIDRLRRLDAQVFPNEQVDTAVSISAQIKVLVNAVELMHNSNPNNGQVAQRQQQPQGPFQSASNNFPSWPPQQGANQYSNYSANAQSQAGTYPYQQGYDTNQSAQMQQQSQQQQQQQQEEQQKHGHPLLKGLARALLSAGSMAAGSMMMGGMGGYGGYGGGYGGYGSMMPGYGGIGGIHF